MTSVCISAVQSRHHDIVTENKILQCPLIRGAVLFGDGQYRPGVLIEPHEPPTHKAMLVEEVWSYVQRANREIPKQLILVVDPVNKPLVWSLSKGVPMRQLCLQAFAGDIARAYSAHDGYEVARL
jgi:hypothetical protein